MLISSITIVRIKIAGKGAAIEKSRAVIGEKGINGRASFVYVQALSCTQILFVGRERG